MTSLPSKRVQTYKYDFNKPYILKGIKGTDEQVKILNKLGDDIDTVAYRYTFITGSESVEERRKNLDLFNQFINKDITLKEFINVIDSTSTLKDFYNTKIIEIKEVLLNLNKKVTDKATQIKINEVNNLISEADKSTKINDDHLVNLLQYYSLIEELKKSNGR